MTSVCLNYFLTRLLSYVAWDQTPKMFRCKCRRCWWKVQRSPACLLWVQKITGKMVTSNTNIIVQVNMSFLCQPFRPIAVNCYSWQYLLLLFIVTLNKFVPKPKWLVLPDGILVVSVPRLLISLDGIHHRYPQDFCHVAPIQGWDSHVKGSEMLVSLGV